MPYKTYGETDYKINLEKDTRNRNTGSRNPNQFNLNKDPSARFNPNLNKPPTKPTFNLNKPPTFNLNKPSERNPRARPPRRNRNFNLPEIVPPQPGMVPIPFTPFYHTPNEPISPLDCERYSNSPFCEGLGFSRDRFTIEHKLVLDNCNLGWQVTPVIFHTYLPDFQIVFRSDADECKPPPRRRRIPSGTPSLNFPDIDPNLVVWVFVSTKSSEDYVRDYYVMDRYGEYQLELSREYKTTIETEWQNIKSPSDPAPNEYRRMDTYPVSGIINRKGTIIGKEIDEDGNETPLNGENTRERLIIGGYHQNRGYADVPGEGQILSYGYVLTDTINTAGGQGLYHGRWGAIKQFLLYVYDGLYTGGNPPNNNWEVVRDDEYIFLENRFEIRIDRVLDLNRDSPNVPLFKNPPPPEPEPPPKPPDDEDMGCSCADIARIVRSTIQSMKQVIQIATCQCNYDDEQKQWIPTTEYQTIEIFCPNGEQAAGISLLYYNQYKLDFNSCTAKNIESTIAPSDFPITLPKSLLTRREGFLSDIAPDEIERLFPEEQVTVENLPRLIIWFIEQFDALLGEWEVPVQVQDIDATKEGDQGVMMRIPNLSEYAGESMGLLLELITDMKTLVNITYRTLMDVGSDKQQNFKAYKMVEALTDYFGFKMTETTAEMPLMFTAGKTKMHEILTESIVNVPIVEFDEKINFQTTTMKIGRIEGILNAQFFRQIDPNGDVKAQIMKYLMRSLTSMEDTKEKNNEKEDDDWKQFINQVEEGFIRAPGTTERTNPYGRPYANRPKIRDLGDLTT